MHFSTQNLSMHIYHPMSYFISDLLKFFAGHVSPLHKLHFSVVYISLHATCRFTLIGRRVFPQSYVRLISWNLWIRISACHSCPLRKAVNFLSRHFFLIVNHVIFHWKINFEPDTWSWCHSPGHLFCEYEW